MLHRTEDTHVSLHRRKAGMVRTVQCLSTDALRPDEAVADRDDLQARTDPTAKKVFGSLAKAASASVDRGKMRKEVGSQMVRQLILK
jgi:hypothetical protein